MSPQGFRESIYSAVGRTRGSFLSRARISFEHTSVGRTRIENVSEDAVGIGKLHQFPPFVNERLAPRETTIGWTAVKTDPPPPPPVFLYRWKLHHVRKRKANLKDATSTPTRRDALLRVSSSPFMLNCRLYM